MIGRRLLERYELVRELGRGGMGVVYQAHDPQLGREVAVKMIDGGEASAIDEARFRREARLAAQLDHPAIVPIYDFGRHEEALFFVMPLLQGVTLDTLIAEHRLALGDVLEIIARVAEALDYSAAEGVIHRDIKPENLMVQQVSEGAPRVWVMDFGLAVARETHRITKSGKLPGTLAYLSPEQILSLDLDGRSDLYSLGTILYECLAGQSPFAGRSQGAVLYRIVNEAPPSLDAFGYDLALTELVSSCLAKEPADRPRRGRELASRLRAYLGSLAVGMRRRPVHPEPTTPGTPRSALPPLFGREGELALLRERLEAALAGECQLVLLAGEAGMGKSRLLFEVERLAREARARVLRGRFAGQEGTFPHHGFCELIQDYFRQLGGTGTSSDCAPEAPTPARQTLAPAVDLGGLAEPLLDLFPVLGEIPALRRSTSDRPATSSIEGRDDATRVFELLARTLALLADGKPLVLLLENLHSAGVSVEALQYMSRRLGPTPTLVVATLRREEVDARHPIRRLYRSFEGDPRCQVLRVGPLTRPAHRQLVDHLAGEGGGEVDDLRANLLFEASDGNPLFTHELVRSLLESRGGLRFEDRLSHTADGLEALPETIQQVVETRLERLPDDLLEVLSVASVLGRRFEFGDLERLAGDTLPIEEAVEQLIREGFLEEDRLARGDVLSFASGMVRDVLHRGLSRRRRRALHRRWANDLEQRHENRLERVYPQLVHHFSEGDEAIKTVSYALVLARRSVGAFSPIDTVRCARTALEFIEDEELEDNGEIEGELRLLLGSALRLLGNVDAALREAGRSVRCFAAAGEPGAAAQAALVAAETAWQVRRVEETRTWLRQGIDLARSAGGGERLGRLLTLAATLANLRGESRRAATLLREAEGLKPTTSGVGPPPAPSDEVLRTHLPSALTTFDPTAAFSLEDAEVLANVFETLVASDADGNLVPRLGVEWTHHDKGRRVEIRLRSGLRFSDGTPCDAPRVRLALAASARRPSPDPAAAWGVIEGMKEWMGEGGEAPRGLRVIDQERIEIRLTEALPIFPSLLTDLRTAIAWPRADGSLLGTGPFRLGGTDPRAPVLERSPSWRGEPPFCARVELDSRRTAEEIAEGLKQGTVDLVRDLPAPVLEELMLDPQLRPGLVEALKRNTYFVIFNQQGPSTASAAIRRILASTIRPQDVVWRTLGRLAQPANGLLPPGILGHNAGRRLPFLGRDEARRLLATEALGSPPMLRVVVHPAFRERYASLERALFGEWRALGFEVEVVGSDIETQISARRDSTGIDLLLSRWAPDYDDPDNFARGIFHSESGAYRRFYCDPELDRRLEQARRTEGSHARRRLYRAIEGRLLADHAILPLFHEVDYRLAGPGVRGVRHLGSPPYVAYSEIVKQAPETSRSSPSLATPPLRIPVASRLVGLEPELSIFAEAGQVIPNLFETLTRVEEGARIAPHLAEELEIEDDGRRLRLRLRRDVRFHDGRQFGARDVRYSFERLLRSPYPGVASFLLPIRGAREFRRGHSLELEGLRVLDRHALSIELDEPSGIFPAMLSNPMTAIVPEGSEQFVGHWRRGLVGTGPYRVVHFEPGRRVELEAHPDSWGRAPRNRRLVFELGVSTEAMALGMREGRWALATGLRPTDVESLRQEGEFAAGFREGPAFSTFFLVLNARRGPFSDIRLRRALRSALDVPGLLRATLGRLALPAGGVIAAGVAGHESPRERDAETDGLDLLAGVALQTSVHPAYLGQYDYLWRRLLGSLHRLGLVTEVHHATLADTLDTVEEGSIDLLAARRLAAYPDPDAFVGIFHSREGLFGRLVGDATLDRLIERGRRESDAALRHAIYRELEDHLAREALIVPLFDEQIYCLAQPQIASLRLRLGWPRLAFEELEWRS